ncbi:MAG: GTP-binding protein [Bacteroidia bacterium]|nr:GTP-binding protein [Bacteroidia bacterium]NND10702.1 GTP-binding protein [Flavobacteriaceae bacterium]MBT8310246.1 GTP-binding protein [Bacteroidia bacterium]NNK28954.1 GTP-binding protein [Flavobacteriaceae bacterium]NNL61545.1 GTP-binding protein [Flavobacteriaceae bacterium]
MALSNEIVLRPRFKIELNRNNEDALKAFEDLKTAQKEFIVSRIDNHVFIKIPQEHRHFWSPQLHLEIDEINKDNSQLYGLFGPNPTVWTLFMFLHFLVATIFIGFGIWAYTNWSLDSDYTIQLFVALFMVVVWFLLYFIGRAGRATGKSQMHLLNDFMKSVLKL